MLRQRVKPTWLKFPDLCRKLFLGLKMAGSLRAGSPRACTLSLALLGCWCFRNPMSPRSQLRWGTWAEIISWLLSGNTSQISHFLGACNTSNLTVSCLCKKLCWKPTDLKETTETGKEMNSLLQSTTDGSPLLWVISHICGQREADLQMSVWGNCRSVAHSLKFFCHKR